MRQRRRIAQPDTVAIRPPISHVTGYPPSETERVRPRGSPAVRFFPPFWFAKAKTDLRYVRLSAAAPRGYLTIPEGTNSARGTEGLHDEALTSRGAGKPLVEGHDIQRGRQSLRGDDGSGKLQRVGTAKRVYSQEPACGTS